MWHNQPGSPLSPNGFLCTAYRRQHDSMGPDWNCRLAPAALYSTCKSLHQSIARLSISALECWNVGKKVKELLRKSKITWKVWNCWPTANCRVSTAESLVISWLIRLLTAFNSKQGNQWSKWEQDHEGQDDQPEDRFASHCYDRCD